MKWFNQNGDKLLAGLSGTAIALGQTGIIPAQYVGLAAGIAAMLHTLFWPDNPVAPAAPPNVEK